MILFSQVSCDFHLSKSKQLQIERWLEKVCLHHHFSIDCISFIFCSDEYLLQMNKEYLQHDYFTDIITFDYSENTDALFADCFISIDRVRDNATIHKTTFDDELLRVMVHGVLHLMGFQDKTPSQIEIMRIQENHALTLIPAE